MIDYNALAQVVDTTWGRSSTPHAATFSVKVALIGPDNISVSYAALVNFGTERQMIEMKQMYAKESESVVAAQVADLKSRYKELTGKTVKVKEISTDDSVEMTGFNAMNARRQAYYRRKTLFEVS
jgi:hypothetical protein